MSVIEREAANESPVIHELFFSSTEESVEEKQDDKQIIWKDVLREGEFAMTPTAGGAVRKPFKVTATGQSSAKDRVISMADIISSYKDKAFEHVTIPLSHTDSLLENTGYVEGLRVVKKGDAHVLQAGLGFTEPDIAGKVRRGTIPNVSCGIFFDWVRKADAKKFRAAMKHVCLTHNPWMNKLDPFPKLLASDDEIGEGVSIEGYQFADEVVTTDDDSDTGTIVWNEQDSYDWVRSEIDAALNPRESEADDGRPYVPKPYYYVRDISRSNTALVEENFKGERTKYVIPFTVDDNKVTVAPSIRWVEAREAMIAASDDNIADNFEEMTFSSLRDKLNESLGKDLNLSSDEWRIEELTLDKRVKITSTDGAKFIAQFDSRPGGSVMLDPVSQWEVVEARNPQKGDAPQPAPSAKSVGIALSDDTPEGRVQAARQRRRALLGRR